MKLLKENIRLLLDSKQLIEESFKLRKLNYDWLDNFFIDAQKWLSWEQEATLENGSSQLNDRLKQGLYFIPNFSNNAIIMDKFKEEKKIEKNWNPKKSYNKYKQNLSCDEILERRGWDILSKAIRTFAGNRSYVIQDELFLIENAIFQLVIDKLKHLNFHFMSVPSLINEDAMYMAGFFPFNKYDEFYKTLPSGQYLIGTSEAILTNLFADNLLSENNLPLLYAAFSPCFRTEIANENRGSRGLIRVNQFYKIEQYIVCKNDFDESLYWHYQLLKNSEEILQDLEIPYEIEKNDASEISAGALLAHDINSFFPSTNSYRETQSCSSMYDWQARRVNLKFGTHSKKNYCFTLNCTAIASPRILAAFLENNIMDEVFIHIPKKLRKFLKGVTRL